MNAIDSRDDHAATAPGIDEAAIDRLVCNFYEVAQRDPKIGPILMSRIRDWEAHRRRMRDFFGSIVGFCAYNGSSLAAHAALSLDPSDFERWLCHFENVARASCPPAAAAFLTERVRDIATGLQEGAAIMRGTKGATGKLTRSDP